MKRTRGVLAAVLGAVVFGLGIGILAVSPLASRLWTRWAPPSAPPASPADDVSRERAALVELGRQVPGPLVWASNRFGNHDVLEGDLRSGRIRRLTTSDYVDTFPRYSPDGRHILFLRSRRPWVSFRDLAGFDLFVMDSDGGGQRRIAEVAYHPAWSLDGSEIFFLRANRLMAVDLSRGVEREVYRGDAEPTSGSLGDPEPGPGGRFALTLRDGPRPDGVGVLTLDPRRYTPVSSKGGACQIAWMPDGGLLWVESEGHGGTRVMRVRGPGAPPQVLMDLPGAYSHEYFPRVFGTPAWLLWGAAAEGHEHDRADYELFAWQLGTPWPSAIRLTYSHANDQWPDLRPD